MGLDQEVAVTNGGEAVSPENDLQQENNRLQEENAKLRRVVERVLDKNQSQEAGFKNNVLLFQKVIEDFKRKMSGLQHNLKGKDLEIARLTGELEQARKEAKESEKKTEAFGAWCAVADREMVQIFRKNEEYEARSCGLSSELAEVKAAYSELQKAFEGRSNPENLLPVVAWPTIFCPPPVLVDQSGNMLVPVYDQAIDLPSNSGTPR